MTDDLRSERTARLQALAWAAAFLAISTNTVEAFGAPAGDWWQAFRVGASVLVTAAVLGLVASRLLDRHQS